MDDDGDYMSPDESLLHSRSANFTAAGYGMVYRLLLTFNHTLFAYSSIIRAILQYFLFIAHGQVRSPYVEKPIFRHLHMINFDLQRGEFPIRAKIFSSLCLIIRPSEKVRDYGEMRESDIAGSPIEDPNEDYEDDDDDEEEERMKR